MEHYELQWKKESLKKAVSWILCVCLVLSLVDVTALAAGTEDAAKQVVSVVLEGLPAGAYTSPDATVEPEEPFGARRISDSYVYKSIGDSMICKVYAWSNVGTLTYSWSRNGATVEGQKTDTFTIDSITEKDYETPVVCTVSDGTNSEQLSFYINAEDKLKGNIIGKSSEYWEECSYGENLELEVDVYDFSNSGNDFTYQWYYVEEEGMREKETPIEGATDAKFSIKVTSDRKIMCKVLCGEASTKIYKCIQVQYRSNNASIVNFIDKRVRKGDEVTLVPTVNECYVDGIQNKLSYTWYDSQRNIVGNEPTYTVSYTEGVTQEAYSVKVSIPETNEYRTQWFNIFFLDENVSAYIQIEGTKRLGCRCQLATQVNIVDQFKDAVSYQWYKGYGTEQGEIEGATESSLLLESLTKDDFGEYTCKVSLGNGESKLCYATLNESTYPITQSAYKMEVGEQVILEPQLFSDETEGVTYAWYKSGSEEVLGTLRSYTVTISSTDSNQYYCVVTKDGKSYRTDNSYIAGSSIPNPERRTYTVDWNLMNQVVLSNGETENATYQWYVWNNTKWEAIDGATESSFVVNKEEYDKYNGVKEWQLRIKRGNEEIQTIHYTIFREDTLTFLSDDYMGLTNDKYVPLQKLDTYTLSAPEVISSASSITYQWYYVKQSNNGETQRELIPGATGKEYTIQNFMKPATYGVQISDGNESQYSIVASLYLVSVISRTVDAELGEKNVILNSNLFFNSGTYKWQKETIVDGKSVYTDIEGATGNQYKISEVTTETLGNYKCIVLKNGEELTSSIVTVTLKTRIKGSRSDEMVECLYFKMGDSYQVEVPEYPEAYGVEYQWYSCDEEGQNGVPIQGANTNRLSGIISSKEDFNTKYCKVTVNGMSAHAYVGFYNRTEGFYPALPKVLYDNEKAVTVEMGESYTMEVLGGEGFDGVSYSWRKCTGTDENGEDTFVDIEGANGAKLKLTVNEIGDYGTYSCIVSYKGSERELEYHICGTATSTGVTIDRTKTTYSVEEAGCYVRMKANVMPINAANRKVIWKSGDETIAKVDEGDTSGFIRVLNEGTVTLTATPVGGGSSDTIEVTFVFNAENDGHKHEWEVVDEKEPTCTSRGWKEYRCNNKKCDGYYYEWIAARHTEDGGVVTKEPSVTETGVRTYYCTVCGEVIREEVIPKLTQCTTHTWGEWSVSKPVTCTENGMKTRTCTVCKEPETEEIPMVEHVMDAGTITKQPTTTETGMKEYHCTTCGVLMKLEEVSKILPDAGTVVVDTKSKANFTVIAGENGDAEVAYKAPTDKKQTTIKIPETIKTADGTTYKVTVVADNAFKNCTKVKKITISSSVETIGNNAFSGCKNATSITIGKNVKEIGNNAFKNCDKVKSITLPAAVKKIGNNAFDSCDKLKTLTIKSNNLTSANVSKNAFKGIKKETDIKVPKKKVKEYKKMFQKKGLNKKVTVKKY